MERLRGVSDFMKLQAAPAVKGMAREVQSDMVITPRE
ncbi:MAG: hypothetical protein JWO13_3467 [Acidobacteriales bacterium]|nr:hypothetical protein [Terriglobales bacterium]